MSKKDSSESKKNKDKLKKIFKECKQRQLNEKERTQIRKVTKYALIQLGAPPDFAGFDEVCVAVELGIENPEILQHACTELYPTVALILGEPSGSSVERNIRSMINFIDENKSFCKINRLLQVTIFSVDDKPTATELIKLLILYYVLDLWK